MGDPSKVLIIGRNNWDDKDGTSSTISNIFQRFDPDKLTYLYIESALPDTIRCNHFFQIPEYSLTKRVFDRRVSTGRAFSMSDVGGDKPEMEACNAGEQRSLSYARKHRSTVLPLMRELLWALGGWKSTALRTFLNKSDHDAVFLLGSPLPLMNRLQYYILKRLGKKGVIFLMDDVWSFKNCGYNPLKYLYNFLLRTSVKKVIKECRTIYVISPKMKEECDRLFGIDSKILTKGVDFSKTEFAPKDVGDPIRIVYCGQTIYGRIHSLIDVASALQKINADGIKAQLFTYTTNSVGDKERAQLEIDGTSYLMPPVPFHEIDAVLKNADVLLYVESMQPEYRNIARVSFSTKIVDYLCNSRAILAIGPADVAPIEYFMDMDAAIVACGRQEITEKLMDIIQQPQLLRQYARRAYDCAQRNHNILNFDSQLKRDLKK